MPTLLMSQGDSKLTTGLPKKNNGYGTDRLFSCTHLYGTLHFFKKFLFPLGDFEDPQ